MKIIILCIFSLSAFSSFAENSCEKEFYQIGKLIGLSSSNGAPSLNVSKESGANNEDSYISLETKERLGKESLHYGYIGSDEVTITYSRDLELSPVVKSSNKTRSNTQNQELSIILDKNTCKFKSIGISTYNHQNKSRYLMSLVSSVHVSSCADNINGLHVSFKEDVESFDTAKKEVFRNLGYLACVVFEQHITPQSSFSDKVNVKESKVIKE